MAGRKTDIFFLLLALRRHAGPALPSLPSAHPVYETDPMIFPVVSHLQDFGIDRSSPSVSSHPDCVRSPQGYFHGIRSDRTMNWRLRMLLILLTTYLILLKFLLWRNKKWLVSMEPSHSLITRFQNYGRNFTVLIRSI